MCGVGMCTLLLVKALCSKRDRYIYMQRATERDIDRQAETERYHVVRNESLGPSSARVALKKGCLPYNPASFSVK